MCVTPGAVAHSSRAPASGDRGGSDWGVAVRRRGRGRRRRRRRRGRRVVAASCVETGRRRAAQVCPLGMFFFFRSFLSINFLLLLCYQCYLHGLLDECSCVIYED